MTAAEIAHALNGRRVGNGYMVSCVSHKDSTPSLHLNDAGDGKVLVHCQAACSQESVIAGLRARRLWPNHNGAYPDRPGGVGFGSDVKPEAVSAATTDFQRTQWAKGIWHRCRPAGGTVVETYLNFRGITLPPPPSLRFHPCLLHRETEFRLPGMVAMVQNSEGQPVAIHRTYLDPTGRRKANVEPNRAMLGPVKGACVRLAPISKKMGIAEGIETSLSVMQAVALPMLAALSAGGIEAVNLPPEIVEVVICADGDKPGERAASKLAGRLVQEKRRVSIARPGRGLDLTIFCSGLTHERYQRR